MAGELASSLSWGEECGLLLEESELGTSYQTQPPLWRTWAAPQGMSRVFVAVAGEKESDRLHCRCTPDWPRSPVCFLAGLEALKYRFPRTPRK